MTKYILILLTFVFISCSSQNDTEKANKEQANVAIKVNPIIGERIDGPANIRNAINGDIIFILYDNVIVECTQPENDWYQIGIIPDNPAEDYNDYFLKKGTKIIVGDEIIGETVKDCEVTFGMLGYTHSKNIKTQSIIENAFTTFNKEYRSFSNFENFINDFKLEKDNQFNGFDVYVNYENWIDDISPMMRFGLVFRNSKLVAILHSRPLKIKGTTDNKLDYGFDCLTYNDIANSSEIVKMFNQYVNSVD